MILIGVNDKGPLNYILEIHNSLNNIIWVNNAISKNHLKKLKSIKNWKNLKPKLILTGTSIGYKIDKKLVEYGKKNNITTIVIIESWGKYKERFFIKNKKYFPDYIIVNDKSSLNQTIKIGIENSRIFIGGNPILERLANSKKILNKQKKIFRKKNIYFISEPFKEKIKNHKYKFGFDEFNCLEDIIKCINFKKYKLIIKMHPSDSKNKYKRFILENKNITLKNNLDMKKIQNSNDIIIGMTSFLLIELSYINNNVYFYTPNIKIENKFIFDNLKFIKRIKTNKQLKKIINNNIFNKTSNKLKDYNGSKKRIVDFINSKHDQ